MIKYDGVEGVSAKDKAHLVISMLVFLLASPVNSYAVYKVAVEQLQPEMPYPGDTVVFKVTMLNEASWGNVLQAEIISPDGIVYPVNTIRSRAGNYLPSTEYISFTIPENAISGNYTLSLRSHDYIFNEARFYVFEKKREDLFVDMSYENNTLTLNISSPTLIRGLRVELLDQLPQKVEETANTSRMTFLPVAYKPLGQSSRYFGDVTGAVVDFSISPMESYIRVPFKLTWLDGEKIITWSGYVAQSPKDSIKNMPINHEPQNPAPEVPGDERPGFDNFALQATAFMLLVPSLIIFTRRHLRRLNGISHPHILKSNLQQRASIFEGDEEEATQKWLWVERCVKDLRYSAGNGRIESSVLRRELGRKLNAKEITDTLDHLIGLGDITEKGGYYEVGEKWMKKL